MSVANEIAVLVEGASVVVITIGTVRAVYRVLASFFTRSAILEKRAIWGHYAIWLLLGLEFALAADIIKTAIAPSWNAIGQLGAIAAIRTFLNYFLERDIERSTAATQ